MVKKMSLFKQFLLLLTVVLVSSQEVKVDPSDVKESEEISTVLKYLNEQPSDYIYKDGRIVDVKQKDDILEIDADIDVTCKDSQSELCKSGTFRCNSLLKKDPVNLVPQVIATKCSPKEHHLELDKISSSRDEDKNVEEESNHKSNEPCLGCPFDLNVEAEGVDTLVNTALKHVESERNMKHALVKVLKLQQQVVAGIKYILLLEIAPTTCPKETTTLSCPIDENKPSYICEIEYWEQPWLHTGKNIVKNNCTISQEYKVIQQETSTSNNKDREMNDDFLAELESQIIPEAMNNEYFYSVNDINEPEIVPPNFVSNDGNVEFALPEANVLSIKKRNSDNSSSESDEDERKNDEFRRKNSNSDDSSSDDGKKDSSSDESKSKDEKKEKKLKKNNSDSSSDSSDDSSEEKDNEIKKKRSNISSDNSSRSKDSSSDESKSKDEKKEKKMKKNKSDISSDSSDDSSEEKDNKMKMKRSNISSDNSSDSKDSSSDDSKSEDDKDKKKEKKIKDNKSNDSSSESKDSSSSDDSKSDKDKKKEKKIKDDKSNSSSKSKDNSSSDESKSDSSSEDDKDKKRENKVEKTKSDWTNDREKEEDNRVDVQVEIRRRRSLGDVENLSQDEYKLLKKITKKFASNQGWENAKTTIKNVDKAKLDGIYYKVRVTLEKSPLLKVCTLLVHTDDDLSNPILDKSSCNKKRTRRSRKGIPGGIIDKDVNDPEVKEFLKDGLLHLDSHSEHKNRYKVQEILSVTSQVVSGRMLRVKAKIVLSECEKDSKSNPDDCGELQGASSKVCNFKIWDQPWLKNGRQTNITCESEDQAYSFRVRRDLQDLESDSSSEDQNIRNQFESFIRAHKKNYLHSSEYSFRLNVFKKNMEIIEVLNKNDQGSATYGITKFADLTPVEFSKMHGLRIDLRGENEVPFTSAVIPDIEIPDAFDWRSKRAVTKVKDQGQCGSCWAFSTTGNVEGQYAIKYNKLLEFSEQELVDCDKLDEGCNGGLMDNAYRTIERMGGLESEQDYPYDAEDEKCKFSKSKVKVQLSGAVNISQDETDMVKWLVQNGPISIAINANAMQFYMGGVSHPWKYLCNPKNLDHGVLIVGYGVDKFPRFNKTLPYWIVKNSWGNDWGEQGYYRVYRGDGTCGVNQTPSSAIVA